MTLSNYVTHWMETYKRNSVKPATFDRLEGLRDTMNRYSISCMDIDAIIPSDIQKYVNKLVDDGYALNTIKKQLTIVVAPLRHASSLRLIQHDPTVGVALPVQAKVKTQKRNVEAYDEEEQRQLAPELKNYGDAGVAAVVLMLETGLRVGECLALDWTDVLWGRRALRIDKTCIRLCNRRLSLVQEGAKTYSSNRTIPLSQRAFDMLKVMRDQAKTPWIFCGNEGGRLSYEALRYRVQKICKKTNVKFKGLHVFRHTFATNCYYRGCDVKILSKLLGHSSTAVTYSSYIDLFGDALEDMRAVVG